MSGNWKEQVAPFQNPHVGRSVWQIANTLLPYFAIWYLIYLSLDMSYWLTGPLIVLAAGFLVRSFIIFHDCGHGSFFKSKTANDVVGSILGIFLFTPYLSWTREHALHHATSGNLDKRGRGDVWTMTVEEYLGASRWKRLLYRVIRNPIVLFIFGPTFLMIVWERFPHALANRREKLSVYWSNLAIVLMIAGGCWIFGIKTFLIVQTLIISLAATTGVWFFYVQHQFEGVYWKRKDDWDYASGAVYGSSYYKLPRVLQWFSGNIGFHHVHHLNSRIPNYRLEACHESVPLFKDVNTLTLFASFKCMSLKLWDENEQKLVRFSEVFERSPR